MGEIGAKELNKILKKSGLTQDEKNGIKHRRRTLKNRNYAASSREGREKEEAKLEEEKDRLEEDIGAIQAAIADRKEKLFMMRGKRNFYVGWAKSNNIQFPVPVELTEV